MKLLLYIFLLIAMTSCNKQREEVQLNEKSKTTYLSISPAVEHSKGENDKIITILEKFLLSKNNSLSLNDYWLDSNFEKYGYPYRDIYRIENSKHGGNFYKPTLMELIDIEDEQKLLKIGFIGVHPETSEIVIKCIFNIVAQKHQGDWKFKRSIDQHTENWQALKQGSVTYRLPPRKIPNQKEITQQKKDIKALCEFFGAEPIPITYYSCDTPKGVFELKGFDYTPNMYFSTTGGMIDYGNVVYSGNNSEIYTHEIVHIYTGDIYQKINRLLDEGIATYIGGSGSMTYAEHRRVLSAYLDNNNLNFAEHTEPYERFNIEEKTSVPYMIGALICERTLRIHGKEKLFEIFNNDADLWTILEIINLTKENITEELKKELSLPTISY